MNTVFTRYFFFLIFVVTFPFLGKAQDLKINELMSSNLDVIYDEDFETPDWIEINNFDNNSISLGNYFLSDDINEPLKWQMPDITLFPNQPLLIFASGKDIQSIPQNWYSPIDKGDTWKYLVPSAAVPNDWNTQGFDDSNWSDGGSGIGYGDNDDETEISNGVISVFMRSTFTVDNPSELEDLWLHMDYDDSFVAYINGVEVARANIGTIGNPVAYNETSITDHEAVIYGGQNPDGFDLSGLTNLINVGENVLAVQVHNTGAASSDMTAIPILTMGFSSPQNINAPASIYSGVSNSFPHTNFKLSSEGETVYLTHGTNGLVDSIAYGAIPVGYSFGRLVNDPAEIVYFTDPTPNAENGGNYFSEAVQSEVVFSIQNTFLTAPQDLELSGAEPGEVIRYTLDSEEPDENSLIYNQAIPIADNTVVRARIFKTDAIPGKLNSRTYIFNSNHDLPVVSITTAPANLWDNETGIYVLGDDYQPWLPFFGANFWEDWERPAHIEMTEVNGDLAFSKNCGIKIFGGWSRANDQKSLGVFFRNIYGDGALEYPLFAEKDITTFKSIILRASGNDWNRSHLRDGMSTSLVNDLNIDLQAYRPAVVYINGEYWGIQNIREKINEDYLESNHGVNSDEVDIIQTDGIVLEGSGDEYFNFISFLENNDISTAANYDFVKQKVDINSYIDYQLSQIYFDNQDWPGNNIKYWRPHTPNSKWRWLLYDTDFGFGIWDQNAYLANTLAFAMEPNGPGWPNPSWSTLVFRKLLENLEFRNQFINRFADMLNTTFQADKVVPHIDATAEVIESEMTNQFNRWPTSSVFAWNQDINQMKFFASERVQYVRNHIQNEFFLPAQRTINLHIVSPNTGAIDLNTITVAEDNWTGVYYEEVPIHLKAIPNPGYTFQKWVVNGTELTDISIELDLTTFTDITVYFTESASDNFSILFNEINYNSPSDNDAGDWIELYNHGNSTIDLSNWVFKDEEDTHEFILPEGTQLESAGFLILCNDEFKFTQAHSNVSSYLGEFDFGLSNNGEAIRLFDAGGILIDSVNYGIEDPWADAANGQGPSLELIDPDYDNLLPENWDAWTTSGGTPGMENYSFTNVGELSNLSDRDNKLLVFPNPFSLETNIKTLIPLQQPYDLEIYNLDGQLLLKKEELNQEVYQWQGKNDIGNLLPTGLYICKIRSEEEVLVARISIHR